ncbi:MAG: hypothetical protein IKK43_05915, partial [Clostridia bacterium]|nr:hypothetical protein [Clostridia bacterium]
MSNLKGKVSLFLAMIMMMTTLLPVFTVNAAGTTNRIMTLTATRDGKSLANETIITINPEDTNRKINVSVNVNSTTELGIYYCWNGGDVKVASTGSKTGTITIPTNFSAGSRNLLQIEAMIDDDANGLVGNSNVLNIFVEVPAKEEATTVDATVKNGSKALSTTSNNEVEVGTKLTLKGTSNKTVALVAYVWDNGSVTKVNGDTATITVPNFAAGSTHTLTVQAATSDAVGSQAKTYKIVIPAKEEPTTIDATVKNGSKALSTTANNEVEVGTKLTLKGTSNKTVALVAYVWDNGSATKVNGDTATITVPNFAAGSTHTLTVQAATSDAVGSQAKT